MAAHNAELEPLVSALAQAFLDDRFPIDVTNGVTGEIIIPAGQRLTRTRLRKIARFREVVEIEPSPYRNRIRMLFDRFERNREFYGIQPTA
jgi:hypothetical protein